MTIVRLYSDNGDYAGFWVQHRRWPNACARVASVNGRGSGKLADGAELLADFEIGMESFDVRSGRPLAAKSPTTRDGGFTRIAEPAWYRPRGELRRKQARSA